MSRVPSRKKVTRYAGEKESQAWGSHNLVGYGNVEINLSCVFFHGVSGSLWRAFYIFFTDWFPLPTQFWLHGTHPRQTDLNFI